MESNGPIRLHSDAWSGSMAINATAVIALALLAGCATVPVNVSIPSADGRLQLAGYWFPAAVKEPRPAIIGLHGCGGLIDERGRLSPNRFRVARYFNAEKMHVLYLDSFTPRGAKSICETPVSQRDIQYEDRREDVFAAIRWLAKQPLVDRHRIVLVGYSNGAGTVLSTLDRTDPAVQREAIQPRAAVAYYPPCRRYVQRNGYRLRVPLLLMIGELDEWTSARDCERLHEKLRREQPDNPFDLVIYPNSHHGFDGYGPLVVRTNLPTPTGKAMLGANPEAREKSLRRMFEFVSAQLRVPLALTHEERLR